jgi:DNA mismatch endonuclease (patch repair protein)
MTDSTNVTASSDAVKQRMSRQASHDTQPELLLRRALHRQGLRYRVHLRPERGIRRQADIVFTRAKVAVFVDGCFWHRCPQHGTEPKANSAWWKVKLDKNVGRDRETDQVLTAAGWTVIRVWEHEDPETAADHVAELLNRDQQG